MFTHWKRIVGQDENVKVRTPMHADTYEQDEAEMWRDHAICWCENKPFLPVCIARKLAHQCQAGRCDVYPGDTDLSLLASRRFDTSRLCGCVILREMGRERCDVISRSHQHPRLFKTVCWCHLWRVTWQSDRHRHIKFGFGRRGGNNGIVCSL